MAHPAAPGKVLLAQQPVAAGRAASYSVRRRSVFRREVVMRRLSLVVALLAAAAARPADLPKMKFNEVKEVAPGVFFRYSSISPTDSSIFGGSNNIWVVFEDYVVVIDANFPKE